MSRSGVRVLIDNVPKVRAVMLGDGLAKAVMAAAHTLQAYARINVEKGFSSRSTFGGGLGESIDAVIKEKTKTYASALVGPTVIYGRIQEFGGTVVPVFASRLHWNDPETGEHIVAKKVTLPPRPYLRPAMDEHQDAIAQAMAVTLERLGLKAVS